ncbi:DUF4192 family protein [Arthrobacter sp. C9C5]|uniref:DUF4192 family protein n=1 Tax=Arthrobacter sp. C9C5 TaxID=2735267 RepID=UPI0015847FC5|nr:DUF4192 family protein [Arthrobacter sp. C9C5]NUU30866.1 DUF4192 family protein [Arthrobacter sp. C9C5]
MTAPDHLKITGPEDILGFIPHSLGYWPANSLVAMTMQGKRLGATLRVDLPDASRCRGPGLAAFALTVRDYLEADDAADGTLLAFFTGRSVEAVAEDAAEDAAGDATDSAEGELGADSAVDSALDPAVLARLLRELERTLGRAGLPVRDAWLVGERYWRNAFCLDPSCCAPPGRPIEEIRNSRLNAELVFRGSSVGAAPGRSTPAALQEQGEPAVLEAEEGWARDFSGRWRDRAQFGAVLDVWERVFDAGGHRSARATKASQAGEAALPAGLAGYLRASLRVAAWRDAVLVMAAAGRDAAEAGAEEFGMFDGGPGNPAALPELDALPAAESAGAPGEAGPAGATAAETPGYGDVLLGLAPPAPDWGRLAELDRVLRQLGNCGGGEARAAALTARGWIEWCRGRGSFADALFTAAGAEQPGYRLAELLAELGRRGTLCGWARRREAAWQKFDPDAA